MALPFGFKTASQRAVFTPSYLRGLEMKAPPRYHDSINNWLLDVLNQNSQLVETHGASEQLLLKQDAEAGDDVMKITHTVGQGKVFRLPLQIVRILSLNEARTADVINYTAVRRLDIDESKKQYTASHWRAPHEDHEHWLAPGQVLAPMIERRLELISAEVPPKERAG